MFDILMDALTTVAVLAPRFSRYAGRLGDYFANVNALCSLSRQAESACSPLLFWQLRPLS